VLDTSVLLYDPRSLFKFGNNIIYIPLIVVEELDRFKKDQNENGRSAREFSRIIDRLREKGPLSEGVLLENGGTLIIGILKQSEENSLNGYGINVGLNDNIILQSALSLKKKNHKVFLISKDINLRLKADIFGLCAEDFEEQNVTLDELYSGKTILSVSEELFTRFREEKFLDNSLLASVLTEKKLKIYPNQYVVLIEEENDRKRLLGRISLKKNGLVSLIPTREGVWNIYPKNLEQQLALDALLNEEIRLVTLVGKAGTGKTLLAMAAGLEQTLHKTLFKRLLVSRPIQPLGKDIGFLPGDVSEKLNPWMQPIFDNMDFLFRQNRPNVSATPWEQLVSQGILHIEPLTYIRGRSIPEQYLVVDEAQNLSPHEVKTIITRAGEGTKIILTGDCEQIDSPYLDSVNNGLAYCVERLKEQGLVGHVELKIGERSELSEMASKFL